MIIERLQAENVLKYARLDLDDIPAAGLIAIVGDNESGKSSIGEAVCFALFGRTFSLGPDELGKVIRWGESRCSIRLDLRTPDGGRYQVARFLDELGNHGASISRPGEQPMVRGVEPVALRLRELIGFGYTELIESFYLAQREISTPKPHSDAVKAMAGIDALERVAVECRRECDQTEAQRAEAEHAGSEVADQIQALNLDPEHLPGLERDQADTQAALAADRERIITLKSTAEAADGALARVKEGVATWWGVDARASYRDRLAQAQAMSEVLEAVGPAVAEDEAAHQAHANLVGASQDVETRLVGFARLHDRSEGYRAGLASWLGSDAPLSTGPGAGQDTAATTAQRAQDGDQTYAAECAALALRTRHARRGRFASRAWGLVAGLFALLLTLIWWVLVEGEPSRIADPLRAALDGRGTDWHLALPWLPGIAATLGLLAIGLFVLGARQQAYLVRQAQARSTLDRTHLDAERDYAALDGLDTQPLPEAFALLVEIRDRGISEALQHFLAGPGGDLVNTERLAEIKKSFKATAVELTTCLARIKAQSGQTIDALHDTISHRSAEIAGREAQIAQEQARQSRHIELTTIAEGLSARIATLTHRVQVHALAVDLLAGAIHYISQRFNTEVRNLSADSLPKFTNGRYQHLQIDQDLKVKAFSAEKHDFMDLDEISSGTQRQIMLAVRLALSQKLVNSVIQGPQSLFLDEPFAFFDESRTASALAVLPQVSRDFTQIWVTSQTFPAASRFDLVVECNARESRSPRIRRPTRRDDALETGED